VSRTGVLLLNVGTPTDPSVASVRRYLAEFLSDPRVITLPAWQRWLLLHGIILRFRPRRSAEAYRKVWTERGSPLAVHSREFTLGLVEALGGDHVVRLGMRYGTPSIRSAFEELVAEDVAVIRVLPLFPQYSSSAWGTAVAEVYRLAARSTHVPALDVLAPFPDDPAFIHCFANRARGVIEDWRPDRVLMSYHGLPEQHMIDVAPSCRGCLEAGGACAPVAAENRACYRAHCFATSRALARALDLEEDRYEVSFQSRLGRQPWILPHTDRRLIELPGEGARRVLVLCASFVADCLETLEEIAIRGAEDFRRHGGEELRLVPSLNAGSDWIAAVAARLKQCTDEPRTSLS
jgi:ferrochelatase